MSGLQVDFDLAEELQKFFLKSDALYLEVAVIQTA